MPWSPISEHALRFLLAASEVQMSKPEKAFWDFIAVEPRKWAQDPWGNEGGGFWVVAIAGNRCFYYNDIEDGFNSSTYSQPGTIDSYACSQLELHEVIAFQLSDITRV